MSEENKAPEAAPAEETPVVEAPKPKTEEAPRRQVPSLPEGKLYVWGTGRRKTSVARVRIRPGSGKFMINDREKDEFFVRLRQQQDVMAPLNALNVQGAYDVFARVNGGGTTGQAGAVSLGLARALAQHLPDCEHDLRDKGLLTRDARMKERKKPGQPGARKRFQFSKR